MSIFEDLAASARRLLDKYGQDITVSRPTAAYNAATRSLDDQPEQSQVLKATLELHRGQRMADSLTGKYERIAYASPDPVSGASFDPKVGDKVSDDGELWVIGDGGIAVERRQGVSILYILGFNSA